MIAMIDNPQSPHSIYNDKTKLGKLLEARGRCRSESTLPSPWGGSAGGRAVARNVSQRSRVPRGPDVAGRIAVVASGSSLGAPPSI